MEDEIEGGAGDWAHERHYTVEQAEAARPWVAQRLERIRDALEDLRTPAARTALEEMDDTVGGSWPGQEVAAAVLSVFSAAEQLEAMDIVLRDADRGLVDFPSIRDGDESTSAGMPPSRASPGGTSRIRASRGAVRYERRQPATGCGCATSAVSL